jgi:metal-responsive CopG/Arc/MetJ family transcriptional regulator
LIDVDVNRLAVRSGQKPMRINISLPERLVHQIDEAARASGATRSGFLARAARQAMTA